MRGYRTLLLAVLALVASEAAAATIDVTKVDRSRPGWVRIAFRYAARGTPTFRLAPICRATLRPEWLVAAIVHLVPHRPQAAIDVRDDLGWLADRRAACRVRGLAVEMVQGEQVVAQAEVPLALPAPPALVALPPAAPPIVEAPRLGVVGRKYAAPQTRMTEAGVSWSVSDRLSLHLSYERTAFAPTMAKDHDDGILTGLKLGF